MISLERGRLKVGPRSAGSVPGPACYGRGGPATLTDANLILGRLDPAQLPEVFGPSGDQALDPDLAFAALAEICQSSELHHVKALARDAVQIADEPMAQAIREISIAEGHDLRGCALIAFGDCVFGCKSCRECVCGDYSQRKLGHTVRRASRRGADSESRSS